MSCLRFVGLLLSNLQKECQDYQVESSLVALYNGLQCRFIGKSVSDVIVECDLSGDARSAGQGWSLSPQLFLQASTYALDHLYMLPAYASLL